MPAEEMRYLDNEAVLDFAVEVGYQLQMAGGEIYRVEESVNRLLAAYGAQQGEVFAIPNCITASMTLEGRPLTRVRRVEAHGTDIWRLEAVNDLCRRLCRQPVPVEEARERLTTILAEEPRYPAWVILLAHFVGAAGFALFFGGGALDALCAGACGISIGLTVWLADALGANLFIKTIASGGISALLALLLAGLGLGRNVDCVTIGALMILVPGVALTNAVRDIMVGDMVSGLSKLAEAVLIAIAIALGTGMALGLSHLMGGLV